MREVVKTLFSLADLETGRGVARVVGGRSVLCREYGLAWDLGGEGGGRCNERGFIGRAFASMFVRHCGGSCLGGV